MGKKKNNKSKAASPPKPAHEEEEKERNEESESQVVADPPQAAEKQEEEEEEEEEEASEDEEPMLMPPPRSISPPPPPPPQVHPLPQPPTPPTPPPEQPAAAAAAQPPSPPTEPSMSQPSRPTSQPPPPPPVLNPAVVLPARTNPPGREARKQTGETPAGKTKNQLQLSAWLIALSSFLWGYGVSVLNVCIVPDAVGSLLTEINLSTHEQETATALVLVGALVSALASGTIGDRFGLKTIILVNNVFFILGGALCAMATGKTTIFVGRFFIGLACGIVTNTVPVLLNEISPAQRRGQITSYHQLLLTIGMLVTGMLGFAVIENVPSGWRYLNAAMVLPAVLQVAMLAWIPESPWWLMKYKGKSQSRATLMRLRDASRVDAIEAELSEIALAMETNAVARASEWSDLREFKSTVAMGTIMVFFQAMTGINTVMLYSAKIFHFAGVTNPFLATAVVGVVNVVVTIFSVSLVDSYGRRPLLLGGTLMMILALIVLSLSLLYLNNDLKVQGAIAVVSVLTFVAGFAVGLGAVVWVVLADITPVKIRSRAFAVFMGVSYVCNILIAVYTLSAISFLGRGENPEKNGIAKLYLILSGVAVASLIYIYSRLPETKNPKDMHYSEEHAALLLGDQDDEETFLRSNRTEL
ncbi:hypothetical protein Poli38472_006627 [Pythium oligandrum]|uniref:Hexose transporter 1 n=1 Tax=Pythium oligandrum TaxID=41045 RepID=A0A8K1C4Y9_PYTOL|nr:hypothetical protein Poli38472_006627 [Pythium oligandrum]|eukprot:TMW56617.1 hypothetical protein Poli38472_006627 [Pythium oligandrum]